MANNDATDGQSSQGGTGAGFHILQPLRDLESNWAVDLAKNLEEYLFKICSGEISADDDSHFSVNFAEAALLLQGSIQVYSRKVEYLYNLVLHALEFISQRRQHDQPESLVQAKEGDDQTIADEENELFLGLDDIPVDAKNSLSASASKDDILNYFVKPPANLVVLEGDCLDANGDDGELESYLLATDNLYEDFILLDPCDAVAVHDFLKGKKVDKGHTVSRRGSSLRSKNRKSFQSPTRQSLETGHKSPLGQNPPSAGNIPNNDYSGDEMNGGYPERKDDLDDSDDDDPWKPLDPHEPGNLRIKPYKKIKIPRITGIRPSKQIPVRTQFPLARLHDTISPEFMEIWEAQHDACEKLRESQSPPLYEKLRQSLVLGGHETFSFFGSPEDGAEDNDSADNVPAFGQSSVDMPENTYMDAEVHLSHEKRFDDAVHFEENEGFQQEIPNSHASLEDLCRSHLDALLASIAESEKQSELAARVSTWKQRIEHNLEEQDSHQPFDIHAYGGRVLDKLTLGSHNGGAMSFADVVRGQEKHDVARTFSALLQLVNDGNVDLERGESGNESICYSASNPFYVRLLSLDKGRNDVQLCSSKKRLKSPIKKGCSKNDLVKSGLKSRTADSSALIRSSQSKGKLPLKLGKVGGVRCTPEGKRRRKSRLMETVDLQS